MPKPGPEHELLKQSEGVWDTVSEFTEQPGAPTMTSKGVGTVTMGGGGFWAIGDFKGDFAGEPFHGHSVDGYDQGKKKYVSLWVDSMASYMAVFEGDYDKEKKLLTMTTETPDPVTGKLMKWKGVTHFIDKDNHTWTGYMPTPDGKEFASMKVTYKRKK